MRRDAIYYVMPVGEVWLVRAIGASAQEFPTLEDALTAAEQLAAKGAQVRVLSRAAGTNVLRPLARSAPRHETTARAVGGLLS
ncbi:MAG TPA: DUF2188 domain-containing protein [Labilithrix sp.]|nr:DUF2188 domain-containing protein [Labilithrix sp.]